MVQAVGKNSAPPPFAIIWFCDNKNVSHILPDYNNEVQMGDYIHDNKIYNAQGTVLSFLVKRIMNRGFLPDVLKYFSLPDVLNDRKHQCGVINTRIACLSGCCSCYKARQGCHNLQGDVLTMNSVTTLMTSHNTEGKATVTCGYSGPDNVTTVPLEMFQAADLMKGTTVGTTPEDSTVLKWAAELLGMPSN
jgi:hypothetical protein